MNTLDMQYDLRSLRYQSGTGWGFMRIHDTARYKDLGTTG